MKKPKLKTIAGGRAKHELEIIQRIFTPEGITKDDVESLKPQGQLNAVAAAPVAFQAPHQEDEDKP